MFRGFSTVVNHLLRHGLGSTRVPSSTISSPFSSSFRNLITAHCADPRIDKLVIEEIAKKSFGNCA